MPQLRDVIRPDGAFVEVRAGWSQSSGRQLRAALRPVPPATQTQAILDTGAEMTCVDWAIITVLGLAFGGTTFANLPAHGGLTGAGVFDVSLTIVHPSGNATDNLVIPAMSVLGVSLSPVGYDVLLGRDLLANCRFLYEGPTNQFELGY